MPNVVRYAIIDIYFTMPFQLISVLPQMLALYKLPRGKQRFDEYLRLLQGNGKHTIQLPVASFNPMAKAVAPEKLEALIALHAEQLAQTVINEINDDKDAGIDRTICVAINLVDDVEGAWSEYVTTDYRNKFDVGGLLAKDFCTVLFFTSETLNESIILERTRAHLFRTVYWLKHGKPTTLRQCIQQESFVAAKSGIMLSAEEKMVAETLADFYHRFEDAASYNHIINFFYGDEFLRMMNFPVLGLPENGGFLYARYLAAGGN